MIEKIGVYLIVIAIWMSILMINGTAYYCIYKNIKRKNYMKLMLSVIMASLVSGVTILFININIVGG